MFSDLVKQARYIYSMAQAHSISIHRKLPTTPATTEFQDVIKGNCAYKTVTLQFVLHVAGRQNMLWVGRIFS